MLVQAKRSAPSGMQNPDNLRVSAEAEELAIAVYDYTDSFPREELYGLSAQMRRAAVSVGSNIFEGCSRKSDKSLIAYLYIAHGSAGEILFQARIAKRRGYSDAGRAAYMQKRLLNTRRMLARLIRKLEEKSP